MNYARAVNEFENPEYTSNTKRKRKLTEKKKILVNEILDLIKAEEYEYRDFLYSLAKEALLKTPVKILKQWKK